MAPIILKIKEGESFPPFSNLDEDDLSKTWRVCTKVKDSLENGSRLENLSWRLWFLQNVNDAKSKTSSTAENDKESSKYENEFQAQEQPSILVSQQPEETPESVLNYSLDDIKPVMTNNFTLNQFTSDQEDDQMIELKDIFPIGMQDYNMYSTIPEDDPIHNQLYPCTPTDNSFGFVYDNQLITNDPSYVTNVSQPLTNQIYDWTIPLDQNFLIDYPMPNATLHNKVLATLPKQTLVSAERLLSPSEQHYYNTFQPTPTLPDDKPTVCSNCEATSTPLWRRSDDKILCNACGLYLKLHNMPRPKHLKPLQGKSKDDETKEPELKSEHTTTCSNCGTSKTPLWRRDIEGLPLCNACGLYLKLHNEKRPLSMKTDVIKKRQRTEALLANTSNDQLKKPKYFDHLSLHARNNTALGYKNAANSLPGTGILMMTTSGHSH